MRAYALIRSKRRTVALYIRDSGLEVRAPLRMPKSEIDELVTSKESWIANKLAKYNKLSKRREEFSLTYGDTVTYTGWLDELYTEGRYN